MLTVHADTVSALVTVRAPQYSRATWFFRGIGAEGCDVRWPAPHLLGPEGGVWGVPGKTRMGAPARFRFIRISGHEHITAGYLTARGVTVSEQS